MDASVTIRPLRLILAQRADCRDIGDAVEQSDPAIHLADGKAATRDRRGGPSVQQAIPELVGWLTSFVRAAVAAKTI